jgi:hypothetical protein
MWSTIARGGATVVLALSITVAAAVAEIDAASVKVAYADGFVGTDGQFHGWESRYDAQNFRAKHADLYHPWRHDDPRHKDDR